MGLHYEDQRTDGRDEYLRESQNRPVIIVRNVCEVCGHSTFDSQYSFFRHLKFHYESDSIAGGGGYSDRVPETNQNIQQRDLDGGAGAGGGGASGEDDNEGFVNDNEQFEEIFANNINKSPDMIEHLEIFIKNQESRTEGYHSGDTGFAMMMIEDSNSAEALAISETVQRVVELVDAEDAELPEATIGPLIAAGQGNALDLPSTIEIIDEMPDNHLDYRKIQIVEEDQQAMFREISIGNVARDEETEIIVADEGLLVKEDPSRLSEVEVVVLYPPAAAAKSPTRSPRNSVGHSENKSKKKMFPCSDCDRKFKSRAALKYHLLSHQAARHFQCTYCDKQFMSKSTLNIHLRIHLEKRPFACPQCEMSFRQKTDLNHHTQSIHTSADDYRYQCDVCKKKFARQYSLNLHAKLHTGEKDHKCEYCDKSFRASSYLKVHLRKHTKEKPYECETCSRPFAIKADLRRHVRQIHEKDNSGKWKTKVVPETDKAKVT